MGLITRENCGIETIRCCLDEWVLSDMILFSSLIIQNLWDPRKIFCLDTITHIWSPGFGDPITQKIEWWRPKMKTHFPCFQDSSPMTQWQFCNKLSQWGPFNQWIVPSIWPLELLPCYSAFVRKIFPKKFPSSHFPLIFTSILTSQQGRSMAPQSVFEDWTRPEKIVRVWRTTPHRSSELGRNLHRRV